MVLRVLPCCLEGLSFYLDLLLCIAYKVFLHLFKNNGTKTGIIGKRLFLFPRTFGISLGLKKVLLFLQS